MEKINILYLITELSVGGAEKAVARMMAQLNRDRYNALVCCLLGRGVIADEIEGASIEVVSLAMKGKLDLRALFRLFKLLKKGNFVVIHSHLFHANVIGRIVGKLARIPIIISVEHNPIAEGTLRHLVDKLSAVSADKVIAVSEAVRKFTVNQVGIESMKVLTIYNGVDLSEKHPARIDILERKKRIGIDPLRPVVGTVSRLDEMKGAEYFVRATAKVRAENPATLFLIVGDGPERAELEQLAQRMNIAESLILTGYRADIPEVLSTIDLFVLPSLYEGLPTAALEAMAMAKPVIATHVGGTPEVVEDKVTGLLVPPRDPEALAEAIITLLQDRERAKAMGRAGRERVERYFSVERMVQQTEALYEELIREKMGLEWAEGEGWQPT